MFKTKEELRAPSARRFVVRKKRVGTQDKNSIVKPIFQLPPPEPPDGKKSGISSLHSGLEERKLATKTDKSQSTSTSNPPLENLCLPTIDLKEAIWEPPISKKRDDSEGVEPHRSTLGGR